jgi:aldehyde dehydrogenase (NAD+)
MRSLNPHAPSDVVLEFEPQEPAAVAAAVERAGAAQAGWAAAPAAARGDALGAVADELQARAGEVADLIVREVGKPIVEARGEVGRALRVLRYYAQMVLLPDGETYPSSDGRSWLMVRRRPLGVCGLVTPWNFPLAIPMWKAAPALAFGNTVVLKPAPQSAALGVLVSELLSRHLPNGCCQLVLGDAEAGSALVEHDGVAAISFTGSVAVGRRVAAAAAARGARVQCEMGGLNPSVVLADADLPVAARTIAAAAMGYAGQKCTATSRIVVERAVAGPFREALVEAVRGLAVVDPSSEDCVVGPVIEAAARAGALDAVGRAGGRVLAGGDALDRDGFYLAPTVVEIDDPGSVLAREEVFGPVAAMIVADGADDAVRIANATRYGLSGAIFTQDLSRAMGFADRLQAGLVRVNAPTSGVDFHAPFGGIRDSSYGPREQGMAARDSFTETHTLLISP